MNINTIFTSFTTKDVNRLQHQNAKKASNENTKLQITAAKILRDTEPHTSLSSHTQTRLSKLSIPDNKFTTKQLLNDLVSMWVGANGNKHGCQINHEGRLTAANGTELNAQQLNKLKADMTSRFSVLDKLTKKGITAELLELLEAEPISNIPAASISNIPAEPIPNDPAEPIPNDPAEPIPNDPAEPISNIPNGASSSNSYPTTANTLIYNDKNLQVPNRAVDVVIKRFKEIDSKKHKDLKFVKEYIKADKSDTTMLPSSSQNETSSASGNSDETRASGPSANATATIAGQPSDESSSPVPPSEISDESEISSGDEVALESPDISSTIPEPQGGATKPKFSEQPSVESATAPRSQLSSDGGEEPSTSTPADSSQSPSKTALSDELPLGKASSSLRVEVDESSDSVSDDEIVSSSGLTPSSSTRPGSAPTGLEQGSDKKTGDISKQRGVSKQQLEAQRQPITKGMDTKEIKSRVTKAIKALESSGLTLKTAFHDDVETILSGFTILKTRSDMLLNDRLKLQDRITKLMFEYDGIKIKEPPLYKKPYQFNMVALLERISLAEASIIQLSGEKAESRADIGQIEGKIEAKNQSINILKNELKVSFEKHPKAAKALLTDTQNRLESAKSDKMDHEQRGGRVKQQRGNLIEFYQKRLNLVNELMLAKK